MKMLGTEKGRFVRVPMLLKVCHQHVTGGMCEKFMHVSNELSDRLKSYVRGRYTWHTFPCLLYYNFNYNSVPGFNPLHRLCAEKTKTTTSAKHETIPRGAYNAHSKY